MNVNYDFNNCEDPTKTAASVAYLWASHLFGECLHYGKPHLIIFCWFLPITSFKYEYELDEVHTSQPHKTIQRCQRMVLSLQLWGQHPQIILRCLLPCHHMIFLCNILWICISCRIMFYFLQNYSGVWKFTLFIKISNLYSFVHSSQG